MLASAPRSRGTACTLPSGEIGPAGNSLSERQGLERRMSLQSWQAPVSLYIVSVPLALEHLSLLTEIWCNYLLGSIAEEFGCSLFGQEGLTAAPATLQI